MGLESATYISDLDTSWPAGTDQKSTADDHLRLIKSVLQTTLPDASAAIRTTSGSFTGTLTGVSGSSTGTIYYARYGSIVVLSIPSISGTSNTTACTITGLPSVATPTSNTYYCRPVPITDNGSSVFTGTVQITGGSGTLTLWKDLTGPSSFTNSGTKGIGACVISYLTT